MERESIYDYLSIIQLVDLTPGFRLDDFYCVLEPYTDFIHKDALELQGYEVSRIHLLLKKTNADVVAYMSLSADSIRLSDSEKEQYNMESVGFKSIPAIKIGHLAVAKVYSEKYRGIGTLLIELVRGVAFSMRKSGVALQCCDLVIPQSGIQWDFNPPDDRAATHALFYNPTSQSHPLPHFIIACYSYLR